ncbi:MAG: M1 family metallopeptidase [candidate division KSB1 bacterium]|nr:M1 family metallopeptidase [candidate division KSB1 bacterium]MDZ7274671.1 M1 family metallopeptidase [candidate division KSB1 bacterium]MDZ7285496.1 M1 family metallopeptidase [candidate division KSB1 bacterium]MDZ7298528.1 M1 family metallopeptidase [candidate division KSB1 bacterium]MDZ7306248.1 M1 family metallopeptidase [candidate division KSB1 bacterium]
MKRLTGLLVLLLISTTLAQTPPPSRPRPYPVFESVQFSRAVARGTRTRSGRPGPHYWQQYAKYQLQAMLDPVANHLSGSATIHYFNHSPDTLHTLAFHLRQNVFRAGALRNTQLPLTEGMSLQHVAVNGMPLFFSSRNNFEAGYTITGTLLRLRLPAKLLPHDSVTIAMAWSFAPPPAPGDGRQGQDGEVFILGYWYPQLAVYDDVSGWVADPYLGQSEFYMGYADYDVRLTVPQGWLVAATGTLQNAREIFSATTLARLEQAASSDAIVTVTTPAERAHAFRQNDKHSQLWHFRARQVRDFAWATSARFRWDATRARTGSAGSSQTVAIHCFYRESPAASAWVHGARYSRLATEFLSRLLWPYPYPHMTAVAGVLDGGGMEYPMLTVIQNYQDTLRLAGNLMHEISHMWFPMHVGSNETRHPWQDEGLTQFNSAKGVKQLFNFDRAVMGRESYLAIARAGREVELMRHGDLFPAADLYYALPYNKTAQVLFALQAILGEETFLRAYREYGKRWQNKHPQPYDFFNTCNDVSGRDLSWFWRIWFYETWTLDQAIAAVQTVGDSLEIIIEDRGLAAMPVPLTITRVDGTVEEHWLSEASWLAGGRRQSLRVAREPAVRRVAIDARNDFPDIDRSNQVWQP